MTDDELTELERLREACSLTSGLTTIRSAPTEALTRQYAIETWACDNSVDVGSLPQEDAEFFLACIEKMPALLAALRETRAALRGLVDALPRCSASGCTGPVTYDLCFGHGMARACDGHAAQGDQQARAAPAIRAAFAVLGQNVAAGRSGGDG